MILKLMNDENLPDDNPAKGFRIVDQVREVTLSRTETGEQMLDVVYRIPNDNLLDERFILQGNAYLMNDAGKTIQPFYVPQI